MEFCCKEITHNLLLNKDFVLCLSFIVHGLHSIKILEEYNEIRNSLFIDNLRKEYVEHDKHKPPQLKQNIDLSKITKDLFTMEVNDIIGFIDHIKHFLETIKKYFMQVLGMGYTMPKREERYRINQSQNSWKNFSERAKLALQICER